MVEESRKKTGCMYLYNWFTVVYAWNWVNIVNQWYFNKNCKKKKTSWDGSMGNDLEQSKTFYPCP